MKFSIPGIAARVAKKFARGIMMGEQKQAARRMKDIMEEPIRRIHLEDDDILDNILKPPDTLTLGVAKTAAATESILNKILSPSRTAAANLAYSFTKAQMDYQEQGKVGIQSDPGGAQTMLSETAIKQTGNLGADEAVRFLRSIDRNIGSIVNSGIRVVEGGGARIGMKL